MQIRALGVITKLTTADGMNRLNKINEKRYVTNQMAVLDAVLDASNTVPDLRALQRPLRHLCAHPTQLYET